MKFKLICVFLFLVVLFLSMVIADVLTGGIVTAIKGANDVSYPVSLNNNESVVGLQMEISYPSYLTYKNLEPTSRMLNSTIVINSETLGILKIAVLDEEEIGPGNAEIFNLIFDVDELAVAGEYDVDLSNLLVADINTSIISTSVINGTFNIAEPYNFSFLPPINLFENFSLQDGATLPLKFKTENAIGFVFDNSVKVRIFNQTLRIDKTYNASGDGDDFMSINETEEQYIVNIHTNQLEMPIGDYEILVSFDNFQKEEIGFELIQNGKGKGKQK